MADRGFDLILREVHLNIPPFLKDKKQFEQEEKEFIITRRVASLRIHVERAMERIKNFHIFDSYISQMYWQGSIKNMKIGQHTTNKK